MLNVAENRLCYRLRINGQVQGVGFRPFVYRLAHQYGLLGWVRNDGQGVEILVQGEQGALADFIASLPQQLPPHAVIDYFEQHSLALQTGLTRFEISHTVGGAANTLITPDNAICQDCLGELFDPNNRRYRHAFINCMHCGPRYTLVAALPYDRANTSMAAFQMCPTCLSEYQDPLARRFHAQPNACPDCGPHLYAYDAKGELAGDPLLLGVAAIRAGRVVAVKGLGGFHLVCDAQSPAVTRLRQHKLRGEKPFAVMVLNTASADLWAHCSPSHRDLLVASERPIVLLDKRVCCDENMPDIAPGLAELGLFLPYTPLQYLLFYELLGRPSGLDWLRQPQNLALVMTSANLAGDALVINDTELAPLMGDLVDVALSHNRDILQRCDDSVCRPQQMIRRARGYVPLPVNLSLDGPPILACGAGLKNTLCLTRHHQAFLSQHIGDLDQASTREMFHASAQHLMSLLQVKPALVVADCHPDYYSSQFAAQFAAEHHLPLLTVLHHHAHIAAVCAEWQLEGPLLGLALDGIGLGPQQQLWGGELLRVDGLDCVRLGGLSPLPLLGGDKAAKQPWRMAVAALFQLGRIDEIKRRFAHQAGLSALLTMLQNNLNCPPTSSMGRYFDAAAALLGICEVQSFEGQAAMQLETLAWQFRRRTLFNRHQGRVRPAHRFSERAKSRLATLRAGAHGAPYDGMLKNAVYLGQDRSHINSSGLFEIDHNGQLNLLPLLNQLTDCSDPHYGAALFQNTLAQALCLWLVQVSQQTQLKRIALSGGCFLNRLLLSQLTNLLLQNGLQVYSPQTIPPNDGGIALGQIWLGRRWTVT